MQLEHMIGIEQAAELAQTNRTSIERRIRAGDLKAYKPFGKVMIDRRELEMFFKKNQVLNEAR